jgi:hypothetical protein
MISRQTVILLVASEFTLFVDTGRDLFTHRLALLVRCRFEFQQGQVRRLRGREVGRRELGIGENRPGILAGTFVDSGISNQTLG